jgi:putative oxidoreductase
VLARIAAGSVLAVMLGAVALVHAHNGFFMNWSGKQAGEGFEYHLLAMALATAVIVEGAGALSVDLAVVRALQARRPPPQVIPLR